jgi:hypothetical protein
VLCGGGGKKVSLPPLLDSSPYLLELYTLSRSNAINFRKSIRAYNGILVCASFGANLAKSFQGQGVFNFKIHGQIYHRIGSLLPDDGRSPVFAQLYIYDTNYENTNRLHVMHDLNANILQNLQDILNTYNLYIQKFHQVRDMLCDDTDITELSMRIYCDHSHDVHCYNAPAAFDVTAI